jgi:hypothetical protein
VLPLFGLCLNNKAYGNQAKKKYCLQYKLANIALARSIKDNIITFIKKLSVTCVKPNDPWLVGWFGPWSAAGVSGLTGPSS